MSLKYANSPRSIFKNSKRAPRLFGHISILQCSSLFWNCRTMESRKFAISSIKLQSHVKILIYWTCTIGNVLNEREMGRRTFEQKGSRNRWEGQQKDKWYMSGYISLLGKIMFWLTRNIIFFYSSLFYFKCFITDIVSSFAEVGRKQTITLTKEDSRFIEPWSNFFLFLTS